MKRFTLITAIFLAIVVLAIFTVNVSAQDKKDVAKEVKKNVVKVLGTEKQDCSTKDCAKTCLEKCTASECQDLDPAKCNDAKCACNVKADSKECLAKHAKGECKDHKPGECCPTDQAKKQTDQVKKQTNNEKK
ncbi:MAG: hypothetical protein MUC94_12805 [bacterium]|jgi:hypothetical protein|nr:hypothetical protein [bacterium]